MPPLPRPTEITTVALPARHGTVAAETDVLVVGGGPAGIGAALGAASAGAAVVVAERYGFLGGNATVALVMPWMSFHTRRPQPPRLGDTSLMPSDHGEGEPVVAGKHIEVIERLIDAGGALPPSEDTGYTVPFDPEVFKVAALDLLDEAGVGYLFHAFASGSSTPTGARAWYSRRRVGPWSCGPMWSSTAPATVTSPPPPEPPMRSVATPTGWCSR